MPSKMVAVAWNRSDAVQARRQTAPDSAWPEIAGPEIAAGAEVEEELIIAAQPACGRTRRPAACLRQIGPQAHGAAQRDSRCDCGSSQRDSPLAGCSFAGKSSLRLLRT